MNLAEKLLPLRHAAALLGLFAATQSVNAQLPESPWMLRGGVTLIQPQADNGQLSPGPIKVDDGAGPSVNAVYFLSPRWTIDVLGALPFEHDFSIGGEAAGRTRHLPPTISLQHYLLPDARVQPFIGVGINYTFFMQERLNSGDSLELRDSLGLAAQVGVDVPLDRHWRLGLDARYIDIDTRARVNGEPIGTVRIDPLVYSLNLGYRF